MRFRPIAASTVLIALLAAGCGGGGEEGLATGRTDPAAALEQAANATLQRRTEAIMLSAASDGAGTFESRGLIDLQGGRFRVALLGGTREFPEVVIGTDGEGFESTVSVMDGDLPGGPGVPGPGGPCWFNPHAPVGSFMGTISVEESARVAGAVVESMAGGEIATAEEGAEPGAYLVRLKPSASHPRNQFHVSKRRIWGARELLGGLGPPIRVSVGGDGSLTSLEIAVAGYRPYVTTAKDDEIDAGTVIARLSPTDRGLELNEPACQAIE